MRWSGQKEGVCFIMWVLHYTNIYTWKVDSWGTHYGSDKKITLQLYGKYKNAA